MFSANTIYLTGMSELMDPESNDERMNTTSDRDAAGRKLPNEVDRTCFDFAFSHCYLDLASVPRTGFLFR